MKKIIYILIIGFLGIENITLMANYTMDFKDTATYRNTGGDITPDHWKIANDSQMVYTPVLIALGQDTLSITFNLKINQSGNLTNLDIIYLYHRINNGPKIWGDTIYGDGLSKVFSFSKTYKVKNKDKVQFFVIGLTLKNNKFWQIKSGDMNISNVTQDLALPIYLNSFTAIQENDKTILNWVTLAESNNNYFTIEKSNTGYAFEDIAHINGAGNSNEVLHYTYTDESKNNVTTYYRLKQTDYDGKFTYSNTIFINITAQTSTKFIVYPNPAKNELKINGAPLFVKSTIVITNALGQIIFTSQHTNSSINTIDISQFETGQYVIQIDNQKQQFIKQY